MRLSDAIILGSTLHKQGFGVVRSMDWDGAMRTCALGAALEAIGQIELSTPKQWKWTTEPNAVSCVHCYAEAVNISWLIAHFNDHHRFTREDIAGWVATIEPKEQPQECAPQNSNLESVETIKA